MRQIFVNLPVRDLERSKKFFASLGFGFDPQFTDEKAACMVVEKDAIHVMLLTEPFFKTFTPRAVADAKRSTEVLVCLSCDSQHEVDDLVAKASSAGGKPVREAKDHGFMYEHAFEDPDGHIWELVHMKGQP
jgi:predicted lactoylglutathione lyase